MESDTFVEEGRIVVFLEREVLFRAQGLVRSEEQRQDRLRDKHHPLFL